MNIQILDSWLREYVKTNATPREIASSVSLSGPSFERVERKGTDHLYDIEITTNRVDAMSVQGVAREVAAILPQYGYKAQFIEKEITLPKVPKKALPLTLHSSPKLTRRLMGVVITDIKNWESPKWMKNRLEAAGIRSKNAPVDITNYVMLEIGHPTHAFDYDKIPDHAIHVRESKKGERITSLEDIEYELPGGDIVFSSKNGEIFDLPGIIGTKNSVVTKDTSRILFFLDNNDPKRIRKTSMTLGIRTVAATLNEKGVDPELASRAIKRGIELFAEVCNATIASPIYDEYKNPYKEKYVQVEYKEITRLLSVEIPKDKIETLLGALGFKSSFKKDTLTVSVPSYRADDITISEDVIEEIARIYGYHNLPSYLMDGKLPDPVFTSQFEFEHALRSALRCTSGVEVFTYSLVSKEIAGRGALRLSNPLGSDTEYLRTKLEGSLFEAASANVAWGEPFHLFEIANVYIPQKSSLPKESLRLGGIFSGYSYRRAKGVIETVFAALNIQKRVQIKQIDDYFVYEFDVDELHEAQKAPQFVPIPKYPPQVEDITFTITKTVSIGELIDSMIAHPNITSVELRDIYEDAYTFRVTYQDPEKTLSDQEVEKIRSSLLSEVKKSFNVTLKD